MVANHDHRVSVTTQIRAEAVRSNGQRDVSRDANASLIMLVFLALIPGMCDVFFYP